MSNPQPVHSITSATRAHTEDLNSRIRRYLISMAIRTVCVVLAVVVDNPVRWAFAVLAVILPYVAVVMANAVDSRRTTHAGPAPVPRTALPASTAAGPAGPGPVLDLADYLATSDLKSDASTERTSPASGERTA